MPEGDTLWRTAAALRPRLAGKPLLAARPPALRRLVGHRITGVDATGKHLFIRFDNGLRLHSHMRMQGSWHVYQPGERWHKPQGMARCTLEVEDCVAVCFNASVVELVASDEVRTGHLGPDILAEPPDIDVMVERARRSDAVHLGDLLRDQTVAAGIGNIWACESLFADELDPWRDPSTLDDSAMRHLFQTAHTLMRRSCRGDRPPAQVHGRIGRLCRRCGATIEGSPQGPMARLTYRCPGCQT